MLVFFLRIVLYKKTRPFGDYMRCVVNAVKLTSIMYNVEDSLDA